MDICERYNIHNFIFCIVLQKMLISSLSTNSFFSKFLLVQISFQQKHFHPKWAPIRNSFSYQPTWHLAPAELHHLKLQPPEPPSYGTTPEELRIRRESGAPSMITRWVPRAFRPREYRAAHKNLHGPGGQRSPSGAVKTALKSCKKALLHHSRPPFTSGGIETRTWRR